VAVLGDLQRGYLAHDACDGVFYPFYETSCCVCVAACVRRVWMAAPLLPFGAVWSVWTALLLQGVRRYSPVSRKGGYGSAEARLAQVGDYCRRRESRMPVAETCLRCCPNFRVWVHSEKPSCRSISSHPRVVQAGAGS